MADIDFGALEKLARAATPGPWRWGDWSATFGTLEDPERMRDLERNLTHAGPEPCVRRHGNGCSRVLRIEDRDDSPHDATYIAAVSPDVVLALIAHARRAEQAECERDEARAALAELQEEADLWREDCVQRMENAADAPARQPLDTAHVEVLRGMLVEERARLGDSEAAQMQYYRGRRIAALEAVLGEEARA